MFLRRHAGVIVAARPEDDAPRSRRREQVEVAGHAGSAGTFLSTDRTGTGRAFKVGVGGREVGGAEAQVAQQTIVEWIDPGVHDERSPFFPGLLHYRRAAHAADLKQHVQFAQPVCALQVRRQFRQLRRVRPGDVADRAAASCRSSHIVLCRRLHARRRNCSGRR